MKNVERLIDYPPNGRDEVSGTRERMKAIRTEYMKIANEHAGSRKGDARFWWLCDQHYNHPVNFRFFLRKLDFFVFVFIGESSLACAVGV